MDIRSYLQENLLLFDGAMGTYCSGRIPEGETRCERANLTHPEVISSIQIGRAHV